MGEQVYKTPNALKLECYIFDNNGEPCRQIRHRSLLRGLNSALGSLEPLNRYKNKFTIKTASIPVIPATAEPTVCKRYVR